MPISVCTILNVVGPMRRKWFLLLGISALCATVILVSGWVYPTQVTDTQDLYVSTDTGRVKKITASPAEAAFGELFMASTIGGANGAWLNPKALSFVQDYMRENW